MPFTNSLNESMDPYTYPGSNVLKNLRDIQDAEQLGKFEMDMTTVRVQELKHNRKPGKFDTSHLQSIHKHIFQDVYPWAGKFRSVDLARSGQFYFAFAAQIVPALENMFGELRKEQHLGDLDTAQFCKRAAFYIGELNAIHPFRDGNGRTQREFIRQLALRNRFHIHWSRITRDQMYDASHRSFLRGDNTGFEEVLLSALAGTGDS